MSSPPDAAAAARRLIALKHLASFAIDVPPRSLLARWKQEWTAEDLQEFRAKARDDLDRRSVRAR